MSDPRPTGKVAIAGGYDTSDSTTIVMRSIPILDGEGVASGGRVHAVTPVDVHLEWTVTSYALCANVS